MSIAFESVPSSDVVGDPIRGNGITSKWNPAIEAALADPTSAIKLVGLTSEERASLTSSMSTGRYKKRFKMTSRKQEDGSCTAWLTAVRS